MAYAQTSTWQNKNKKLTTDSLGHNFIWEVIYIYEYVHAKHAHGTLFLRIHPRDLPGLPLGHNFMGHKGGII